jgi:hypothetical protein
MAHRHSVRGPHRMVPAGLAARIIPATGDRQSGARVILGGSKG